jgi:hypothetical protein
MSTRRHGRRIDRQPSRRKVSPAPAVYYAPGKILRAGTDVYAPKSKATGEATIVDITDIQNPTIRSTNPMIYARNRGT